MSALKSDSTRATLTADVLKALSHPLRLMIVAQLAEGAVNVGDLAERLGAPPSVISQQLRILRMSKLVEFRRSEGCALYSLAKPRLVELLRCLDGCQHGDL